MYEAKMIRSLEQITSLAAKLTAVNEATIARARGSEPQRVGFPHGGAFLQAVRGVFTTGHTDSRLLNSQTVFGGESAGPEGGYLVPPDQLPEVATISGPDSLLGMFRPVISSSNLLVAAVDEAADWTSTGISAARVAEGAAASAPKPAIRQVSAVLQKYTSLAHAGDELDSDTSGAFSRYVFNRLLAKIRGQVEHAILWGVAGEQPSIVSAPATITVPKESAQSGTIVGANVAKMISRLPVGSFGGSFWITSPTGFVQICALGFGYYQPGAGHGSLVGRPIFVSEYASPLGTLGDLILVGPDGYLAGVQSPSKASVIGFAFDQHLNSYRATLRAAVVPLLSAPITSLLDSSTRSHTVVLQAR